MNQQLIELAEKAGFIVTGANRILKLIFVGEEAEYADVTDELAKFAELILQANKQDTEDAKRYRYIRDNDLTSLYCDWISDQLNTDEMDSDEFDKAIDSAMEE